jgi:hypothetical protein
MTTKQLFFFFLIFILYLITFLVCYYNGLQNNKGKIIFVLSSLVYILLIYGYTQKFELFKEHFTELTPRYCTSGPYMWNGNGPVSKYCKNLISTQEGQEQIKKESCGPECKGRPLPKFEYTVIDDRMLSQSIKLD